MRQLPILALGALTLIAIAMGDFFLGQRLTSEQVRLNTLIQETHSTSSDLISSLGFGGVIHNFKNYVLRSETRYMNASQAAIEHARLKVDELIALAGEEDIPLTYDNTHSMLAAYEARLMDVTRYAQQGLSPAEIDERVAFDDGPALAEISANRSVIIGAFDDHKSELSSASMMKTAFSLVLIVLSVSAAVLLLLSERKRSFLKAIKAEHQRTSAALNQNVELNKELTEANKRLEQYSYLVAHDIKSPFRQISMLAHMANMKIDGSHEAKPLLSKINECTDQAQLIIQSFLGLAQVKYPFKDVETFSLSDAFKYAQKNFRYSDEADCKIEFGELGQIQADRGLINQLAVNLVNNSVKYARPNTQALIQVTSEIEGEFLRVHVKDNGVGISPQHIGSVFEPLYRAPTTKRTKKGTGLGLSICKSIVEAHGGEISVSSTVLNGGATFSFTLPLPQQQPHDLTSELVSAPSPHLE